MTLLFSRFLECHRLILSLMSHSHAFVSFNTLAKKSNLLLPAKLQGYCTLPMDSIPHLRPVRHSEGSVAQYTPGP